MVDTPTGILAGWIPATPAASFTPVTVESPESLCGTELPDGRALLMWTNGGNVRGAILANTNAWLANSVVAAGNIFTAFTAGGFARVACFVHAGDVWAVRSRQSQSSPFVGDLTIWKATDPANPDTGGWTQQATLHTVTAGGSGGTAAVIPGIPHYHAATGLYAVAGNAFTALGGSSYGSSVGIWTATALAGPWTRRLTAAMPGIGGPFNFISGQMAEDGGGNLHVFVSHTSGTQPNRIYRSTNGGISWSLAASNNSPRRMADFVWNGSVLYTSDDAGALYELTGAGTTWGDWTNTGELWAPSGQGGGVQASQTRKLVIATDGIHAFWLNRVATTPAPSGGWVIGAAPIGTQVQSGWQ